MPLPEPSWLVRTRPCPFYSQGRCLFADSCNFLHSATIKATLDVDNTVFGSDPDPPDTAPPLVRVHSPQSIRSPPRSPRLSSLLHALKDVIGEDEDSDELLDECSPQDVPTRPNGSNFDYQNPRDSLTLSSDIEGLHRVLEESWTLVNDSESTSIAGTKPETINEAVDVLGDELQRSSALEEDDDPTVRVLKGSTSVQSDVDASVPPSNRTSGLLSPVDISGLSLGAFMRDRSDFPPRKEDSIDSGYADFWITPQPLALSPPRSPTHTSTFSLLTSPFGSPSARVLSPRLSAFIVRTPPPPSSPGKTQDDDIDYSPLAPDDNLEVDLFEGDNNYVLPYEYPEDPHTQSLEDEGGDEWGGHKSPDVAWDIQDRDPTTVFPGMPSVLLDEVDSPIDSHSPSSPLNDVDDDVVLDDSSHPELHTVSDAATDTLLDQNSLNLYTTPILSQENTELVSTPLLHQQHDSDELEEESILATSGDSKEGGYGISVLEMPSLWPDDTDSASTGALSSVESDSPITEDSLLPPTLQPLNIESPLEGNVSERHTNRDLLEENYASPRLPSLSDTASILDGGQDETLTSYYNAYMAPEIEDYSDHSRAESSSSRTSDSLLPSRLNAVAGPSTTPIHSPTTPSESKFAYGRVFTPPPSRGRSGTIMFSPPPPSPSTSSYSKRPLANSPSTDSREEAREVQAVDIPSSKKVPFGFRNSFSLGRATKSSLMAKRVSRSIPPPIVRPGYPPTPEPSPIDQRYRTSKSPPSPGTVHLRPLRLSTTFMNNSPFSPPLSSHSSSSIRFTEESAKRSSMSSSASVSSGFSLSNNPLLSTPRSPLIPEHIRNQLNHIHNTSSKISTEHFHPNQPNFDEPQSPPVGHTQSWRTSHRHSTRSESFDDVSRARSHMSEPTSGFGDDLDDSYRDDDPRSAYDQTIRRPIAALPVLSARPPSTTPSPSYATARPTLLFAIASDDVAQVRKVLESGEAGPNDPVGPQSALAFTLTNDQLQNKLDIVKTLLAFGADPSALKDPERNPQHRGSVSLNSGLGADAPSTPPSTSLTGMDPATRYYVTRADSALTRRTSALINRSFFRPLTRARYDLVGQDRVFEQLFRVLSMHSQQLSVAPIVALFCGPSGHGKSLLARKFGSLLDVPTHTVNMTTLESTHDLWQSRSVDPYEEPSTCTLAEFLINNEGKRCVVVLDEIEKTDEKSLWSLLMPWELGRCSLQAGSRHVDVRNVIWLGTSNIGYDLVFEFCEGRGSPEALLTREEYVELMARLRPRVSDRLGPSLLSRITTILPFVPFSFDEKMAIAAEAMHSLGGDLVRDLSPESVNSLLLASLPSYVPVEGARSLYRAVSSQLVDAL